MDIREKLTKLRNLVDPGTILGLYGATREDLDLLIKVEEIVGRDRTRSPGRRPNG